VAGAVAIARACTTADSKCRVSDLESPQTAPFDNALGIVRVVGSRRVPQSDGDLALPRENATANEQADAGL